MKLALTLIILGSLGACATSSRFLKGFAQGYNAPNTVSAQRTVSSCFNDGWGNITCN